MFKGIRKFLFGSKPVEKSDPDVETVAERTGRPYSDVLHDMKEAKENHGISFSDYVSFHCEECVTEEDFEAKKRFIRRRKRLIRKLCEETGWSGEQAVEEIDRIRDKFGITPKKYYTCGMYAMDDEEIAAYLEEEKQQKEAGKAERRRARKNNDPDVKIVVERTGISYEEALQLMKEARNEHGLSFHEYAIYRGEQCSTKEEFDVLKDAIKERRRRRRDRTVMKLCEATGWTEERAEAEILRVSEKFGITARKYYAGGMYLMDDVEIAKALENEKARHDEVRDKVIKESGWSARRTDRHMRYALSKYGIDATDYMLIKAWRFSDKELSELSSLSTTRALTAKYNDPVDIGILSNKLVFNRLFTDCIQRKFWTNDEEAYFESFCAFWEGLDEAMFKPLSLFQARGIHKIMPPEDMRKTFREYQNSPQFLLEEVVKQHPAINEIYSGSVNTVRMVTLLKDDEFHVLCAFMKFGKGGGVVDNMIAGGMIAGVDEVNGVIETGAVDRDGNVYETHPDTGRQIKGFRIPNYDKVLELTERALRKVPGINFVGWDVAVCQDKAVIIEGNSLPGLMAYQLPYVQPPLHEPKRYKFEPYL